MYKSYRAGIIGCGNIASEYDPTGVYRITTHAGAYNHVKETKLVALSDINKDKLNEAGKKWKVDNLYLNYNEMLERENLDILSICTWSNSHYQILKEATNYNPKAIFCEKPIANSLKQADKMIKLCKDKNIILAIGHQRRYDPFHNRIKTFIDQGNIGTVQQASFYYSNDINNFGSHMFDLLRFFFGEVKFVQAYNNSSGGNLDGLVRFKNGLNTTIQSLNNENYSILDLYVIGSEGALRINRLGLNLEVYKVKDSDLLIGYKELLKTKSKIVRKRTKNESPMVRAIEDIIDCIENKHSPISSGKDGREALSLICAFHESAMNDGKKIKLPLKTSNVMIN